MDFLGIIQDLKILNFTFLYRYRDFLGFFRIINPELHFSITTYGFFGDYSGFENPELNFSISI
jgi:hypothetical protein